MVPPTVRTKFSSKLIPVRGHERRAFMNASFRTATRHVLQVA